MCGGFRERKRLEDRETNMKNEMKNVEEKPTFILKSFSDPDSDLILKRFTLNPNPQKIFKWTNIKTRRFL